MYRKRKLADALWPGAEGDAAAQALTTTLFRLRKLIGEQVIRRQDGRLTLDPTLCWVDCWAFERLSNDDSADPPQRLEKLRRLHQGPFLDGADDAPWAQPMRERLHAKLTRLLRTFVGTVLARRRPPARTLSFCFLGVRLAQDRRRHRAAAHPAQTQTKSKLPAVTVSFAAKMPINVSSAADISPPPA